MFCIAVMQSRISVLQRENADLEMQVKMLSEHSLMREEEVEEARQAAEEAQVRAGDACSQ